MCRLNFRCYPALMIEEERAVSLCLPTVYFKGFYYLVKEQQAHPGPASQQPHWPQRRPEQKQLKAPGQSPRARPVQMAVQPGCLWGRTLVLKLLVTRTLLWLSRGDKEEELERRRKETRGKMDGGKVSRWIGKEGESKLEGEEKINIRQDKTQREQQRSFWDQRPRRRDISSSISFFHPSSLPETSEGSRVCVIEKLSMDPVVLPPGTMTVNAI